MHRERLIYEQSRPLYCNYHLPVKLERMCDALCDGSADDKTGCRLDKSLNADEENYEIEGIGNDFIAATMDTSFIDKVYKIKDEEALAGVRQLAGREGIFAGSSSGAALAAALKLAHSGIQGNIVLPVIDRAERYFSKHILEG